MGNIEITQYFSYKNFPFDFLKKLLYNIYAINKLFISQKKFLFDKIF